MGIDWTQLIALGPINYCQDPRTLNAIQTTITVFALEVRNLHWLPISQKVVFKTALLVWKCVRGVAPVYLRVRQELTD